MSLIAMCRGVLLGLLVNAAVIGADRVTGVIRAKANPSKCWYVKDGEGGGGRLFQHGFDDDDGRDDDSGLEIPLPFGDARSDARSDHVKLRSCSGDGSGVRQEFIFSCRMYRFRVDGNYGNYCAGWIASMQGHVKYGRLTGGFKGGCLDGGDMKKGNILTRKACSWANLPEPAVTNRNQFFFYKPDDSTIRSGWKPDMCLNAKGGDLESGDLIQVSPCSKKTKEKEQFIFPIALERVTAATVLDILPSELAPGDQRDVEAVAKQVAAVIAGVDPDASIEEIIVKANNVVHAQVDPPLKKKDRRAFKAELRALLEELRWTGARRNLGDIASQAASDAEPRADETEPFSGEHDADAEAEAEPIDHVEVSMERVLRVEQLPVQPDEFGSGVPSGRAPPGDLDERLATLGAKYNVSLTVTDEDSRGSLARLSVGVVISTTAAARAAAADDDSALVSRVAASLHVDVGTGVRVKCRGAGRECVANMMGDEESNATAASPEESRSAEWELLGACLAAALAVLAAMAFVVGLVIIIRKRRQQRAAESTNNVCPDKSCPATATMASFV